MLADNSSSSNTNPPQTNSFQVRQGSVEVSRVLRAIFKKTEKLLYSLTHSEGTARSIKLNFMISIKTMHILYGRFLALYRWNIINQTRSINSREIARRIAANKRTLANMQTFTKQFLQMKFPSDVFPKQYHQNLIPLASVSFSPYDIAVRLVQISTSLFQIQSFYSNHVLSIFKQSEFFFQLHISSSGKLNLKSFSVQWPKKVKFLNSQFLKKYSSILSTVVKISQDPISGCCNALHKLYQIGKFANIYMKLQTIQSKHSFQLSPYQEGAMITFPESFSPNNVFTISLLENDIILVSKNPMYTPFSKEKRFISFKLTSNRSHLESVISEIRISTYFTRLEKIWGLINQSLTTISWKHQFRGEFIESTKCIEIFLFDYIVMRIKIESDTGNIDINTFGGIGMNPSDFITSIEGCECQRNEAIKIVFLHSLSRILFNDIISYQFYLRVSPEETTQKMQGRSIRSYRLSYSNNCFIVFGEKNGRLSLSIVSSDGSKVSTPEIIMINSESESDAFPINSFIYPGFTHMNFNLQENSIKAAQSAKMAVLILQLFKALKNRGIAARNENGRVHFILDPFECIEFHISQNSRWSLKFVKPSIGINDITTMVFVGNSINSRFIDWILHIVWSVSTFMLLLKQSLGIYSLRTIVKKLDIESKTCFAIEMANDICSRLTISISSLKKLKAEREVEVYHCDPMRTPQINFSFSRHVQLKRYLQTILRSGSITFLFGSFLNSSFIPLQHFSNVFTGDPSNQKWSITDLCDDGSFFLIFQREMSINFMVRPAQMFQLIIPSIGKSKFLQIPLESLPILSHLAKLSHPTWKLHMNQLDEFKNAIEKFFHFRYLLGEVGFRQFVSNGQEVYSPFMVNIPYVNIVCYIRPDKIEFDTEIPEKVETPEVDIANNIKKLLNFQFGDVETQILAIKFVKNIVAFDQRFVGFVMMLLAKLIEKTKELKFLWRATFESSAVMPEENKVVFNLSTEHGTSCVEIDRREGDLNPEIIGSSKSGNVMRIKSLRELFRWIQSIEQEGDGDD